jgi:hypothetical protein
MTDFVVLIGIVVFLGLLVALAGPIRAWFSDESKLFLHDIKPNDELDLEEAQREAGAKAVPKAQAR